MTQQDDNNRSLWGEEPNRSGERNTTVSSAGGMRRIGQIAGLVLFIFVLFLTYLLTDPQVKVTPDNVSPFQQVLTRLLPTLIAGASLVLLYGVLFVPGTTRTGRIMRSVSTFWAGGLLLASLTYLVMGWLIPSSAFAERLIVPALLLVLLLILGLFSPTMSIWPLNVPDGQVWMVLDIHNHLENYIGQGLRWVRPIDGFEPYQQGGALVIDIDDEGFVSHDNFPFRVKAKIVCLFNPLNAEKDMWVPLRNMSRDVLQDSIRTEVMFIIQNELLNDLRDQIRAPGNFRTVLNRIYIDIKEAVDSRANIGIRLAPTNPINVTLLPTQMVTDASERLIALEAVTGGGRRDDRIQMLGDGQIDDRVLSDVIQLAARDGDLNINFDQEGNVRFLLATGDEVDIGDTLSETLVSAARVVMDSARQRGQTALPAPQERANQASAAVQEAAVLGPGQNWEEVNLPEPPGEQVVTPDSIRPSVPESQEAIHVEPGPTDDDVIETEPDNEGVFKAKPRRNPIIPDNIPDEP